jgi:hypothetical protein
MNVYKTDIYTCIYIYIQQPVKINLIISIVIVKNDKVKYVTAV